MSVTGIIRRAWVELWRTPVIFNLVFWSLMLTILVDVVFGTRLAPLMPAAIVNPRLWLTTNPVALWAHFPASSVLRVGLFLASVVLIVTPFRIAGLYGGTAELLNRKPLRWSYFAFFTTGWRLFWRGLGTTLAGIALLLCLFIILIAFSYLGQLLGPGAFVLAAIWVAVVVWAVGLSLLGLGSLMANDRPEWDAISQSLAYAVRHWGFSFRLGLLLAGLMVAALAILAGLSSIPFLGPLMGVMGFWVMTGYLAVLPTVLYQSSQSA